jgi:hypothetical protein
VVATHDAGLRRQLRDVLQAGGLTIEATAAATADPFLDGARQSPRFPRRRRAA